MNLPDRITIDPQGQAQVRDLAFRPLKIYHDLVFKGIPEAEILEKYPGLEAEDLVAVSEYVIYVIQSRDHDEITGRMILPRDELKDGAFYKGRCRNCTIARWNAAENCFYHWRQKFGRIYIETIKYPTDEVEPWWDVFDVVEELPNPKFEIPFDDDAEFQGNRSDLTLYNEEMWGGMGLSKHTVDTAALLKMRDQTGERE